MTAHAKIAAPEQSSDNCCDLCCAGPVVTELDGDTLCQTCADKWCRAQQYDPDYDGHAPDEDEIADLRRSLRGAGVYRGAMIEARLSDPQLTALSRIQRQLVRQGGL